MLRGKHCLFGVMLVRRSDVDGIDLRIRAQRCSAVVNPRREFLGEPLPCFGAQIRSSDERNARIARQGWKHDGEGPPKPQNPNAQFAL